MNAKKIAIVGGGSLLWTFGIVRQFIASPALRGAQVWLMDLNPERLELVAAAARQCNRDQGAPIQVLVSTNLDEALEHADFVLVTISTGGLDAMAHDLAIPEQFGIYHTVGDTVGPGGWLRAVRNLPIFDDLGRRMARLCPEAWLLNMTNPLTPLTRVTQRNHGVRTVGMCPGVEEQARTLSLLAGVNADAPRDFTVAGVDHGSYFLQLHAGGVNVLDRLREMGFCRSDGQIPGSLDTQDGFAGAARNRAVFALWRELGYMPAINDRHMVENHAGLINGPAARDGRLPFHLERTTVPIRAERYQRMQRQLEAYLANPQGNTLGNLGHGDDPVVTVIESLLGARSFLFCSNYMNVGQTPQAPLGAVVEMRCRFDAAGVHPLPASIPPRLLPVILPTLCRQEAILDVALGGTFDELVTLVAGDPLCSHLELGRCRSMVRQMLQANQHLIANRRLLEFEPTLEEISA